MTLNQRIDTILGSVFRDADPSNSFAYFEKNSNLYTALALGRLFWADVTVIHEAVFLVLREGDAREVDSRITAQIKSASDNGQWRDFVDSFNRFEVRHLFLSWSGFPEVSSEAEFLLAELLVEVWSARLSSAFPDREFSVRMEEPVGEEGPCVLISQIRPPLAVPEGWTK
ncbi:hypothetical protein [Streptomyces sp. NPDC001833]|uniref:hypothetical protein n=1 Tax=Streptomyces sp. NPDC001833 TaxID=3154658 RepID=UPI0033181CAF